MRFIASHKNLTPTATADTTDLVDSTYPLAIQGGSATQRSYIMDLVVTGSSGGSTPTIMTLGRSSQVATGSLTKDTNLLLQAKDPAAEPLTLPPLVFNKAATLKPRRSSTLGGLLAFAINAYGGAFRIRYPEIAEGIPMLGLAASFGELSLSAFTGGTPGALTTTVEFETL